MRSKRRARTATAAPTSPEQIKRGTVHVEHGAVQPILMGRGGERRLHQIGDGLRRRRGAGNAKPAHCSQV